MPGDLQLHGHPRFRDRREAGAALADALAAYQEVDPVVLGIPRGGVPVAAEVAHRLGAELDIIVARKIGFPGEPEFAIGAVSANGGTFLDEDIIQAAGVSKLYLEAAIARECAEARRREGLYRGDRPAQVPEDRVVIVVDDGLATGATMWAAVRSVRKHEPSKVVVAVPVGSRKACEMLRAEADVVVCCAILSPFMAVGAHYEHFDQVSDADVMSILAASRVGRAA